jgi:GlpG protein
MRQIGTVGSARDAERLTDYLLTKGIRCRVDSSDGAAAIWVYDEDQRDEATRELGAFNEHPTDPRYDEASRQARELERKAAADEKRYRKNVVELRTRWDSRTAGRRPVTILLVALSCAVAVTLGFGGAESGIERLSELWFTPPVFVDQRLLGFAYLSATLRGQWWRLVTPIFIHMSLLHLVFNMFWTIDLGSQIELRRGSWRMLGIVLAIAVFSNLGEYWWSSSPQFGGMSGVVYGMFGYLWIKSRIDAAAGFFMHPTTVIVMMLWFVLCLTGAVGSVANGAHAAGLATGALMALLPTAWRRL